MQTLDRYVIVAVGKANPPAEGHDPDTTADDEDESEVDEEMRKAAEGSADGAPSASHHGSSSDSGLSDSPEMPIGIARLLTASLCFAHLL